MKYHTLDPSVPGAVRRALHRAEGTAVQGDHRLHPWRQESPRPGVTRYSSRCAKAMVDEDGQYWPCTAHGPDQRQVTFLGRYSAPATLPLASLICIARGV
jgi:hypothetical protein